MDNNKLNRMIDNLASFIELGVKILRNNQCLEKHAGHFLIVLEGCIEEFENLCAVYEEINKTEHYLWLKHGEEFSQEWYELNKLFTEEE